MVEISKIIASVNAPSLAAALQQAELTLGKAVEAKVQQILSDGFVRLATAQGPIDVKASSPALQVGTNVRVELTQANALTLTVLPQNASTSAAPAASSLVPQSLPAGTQTPNPAATSAALHQISSAPSIANSIAPPSAATLPSTASPPPAPTLLANFPDLGTTIANALAKQDSLSPLFANLEALSNSRPSNLPAPLRNAIDRVLQTRLPATPDLNAATVQEKISNSGLFLENRLARGLPATTPAAVTPLQNNPQVPLVLTLPPVADLKSALLVLANVLKTLSPRSPIAPAAPAVPEITKTLPAAPIATSGQEHRQPPPQRGDAPAAQATSAPSIEAGDTMPTIIGKLSEQTEAALSRLRLLQIASQGDIEPGLPRLDARNNNAQTWHIELPLALPGQPTIVQMQIEREALKRDHNTNSRVWRVRFALDVKELGPVHALLVLGSGAIGVTLWAERDETLQVFQRFSGELRQALSDENMDIAEFDLRAGHPRQQEPKSGAFLDTRT